MGSTAKMYTMTKPVHEYEGLEEWGRITAGNHSCRSLPGTLGGGEAPQQSRYQFGIILTIHSNNIYMNCNNIYRNRKRHPTQLHTFSPIYIREGGWARI
jgi:hypothetical protein